MPCWRGAWRKLKIRVRRKATYGNRYFFYSERQLGTESRTYIMSFRVVCNSLSRVAIKLFIEKDLFLFFIPRRWRGSRRASLTSQRAGSTKFRYGHFSSLSFQFVMLFLFFYRMMNKDFQKIPPALHAVRAFQSYQAPSWSSVGKQEHNCQKPTHLLSAPFLSSHAVLQLALAEAPGHMESVPNSAFF